MNGINLEGMRAVILTDGKAGHENQSRAFARALGFAPGETAVVKTAFRFTGAKALSYLLDRLGIRSPRLLADGGAALCREARRWRGEVRVVIGTGSGTFYAAKTLAGLLGAKCGVVLYPRGYSLSGFDCILAPSFDNPPQRPNIVSIPANLVAADAAFYERGVAAFRERTPLTPDIAAIVGGPNKCSTMTVEWMRRGLDAIFAQPGVKMVTTSRRTPPEVEALVDSYPWDWKLIYSRDTFNPIPAFVTLAKRLYVTAESTGMLSEACTSGATEVTALDNLKPGGHKFRRFVESLRRGGYIDGARKIDLSEEFSRAARLMGVER